MVIKSSSDGNFMYSGIEDPQILIDEKEAQKEVSTFVEKYGKDGENYDYLEDANILREALDDFAALKQKYLRGTKKAVYHELLYVLHRKEDDHKKIKALYKKSSVENSQFLKKISFFEPSLTKISEKNQIAFLTDENLKEYRNYLQKKFALSKHNLSKAEEAIFTLLKGPAYQDHATRTRSLVTEYASGLLYTLDENGELSEGRKKHNYSQIRAAISHVHPKIRESAAKAYNKIINKYRRDACEEMNSVMKYMNIERSLRKYEESDSNELLTNEIDRDTMMAIFDATNESTGLSEKYFQLKANILFKAGIVKTPGLHYTERNVPVTFTKEVKNLHIGRII